MLLHAEAGFVGVEDAAGAAGVEEGLETHDQSDEPEHPEHPERHTGDERRQHERRAVDPDGIVHGQRHDRDERRVEQARQHHEKDEGRNGLGALEGVVVGHEQIAREAGYVVRRDVVDRVGRDHPEDQGQTRAGVRGVAEPVRREGEQRQPGNGENRQTANTTQQYTGESCCYWKADRRGPSARPRRGYCVVQAE